VYEEDAAKGAALLKHADYVALPSAAVYFSQTALQTPVAGHQARAYRMWYQAAFGAAPPPSAILFLHELRTPAGIRRLVLVEREPQSVQPLYAPFELRPTLYEPAPMTGVPVQVPPSQIRLLPINMPVSVLPPASLRFFVGQIDPSDPAHFTIAYEMTDGRGLIDGRLTDDASTVRFVVRDGPAQAPSGWGTPIIPEP
jgi:hypothetical protein